MTPEQIKTRMKQKKLSQRAFAKRVGVSQTAVHLVIFGKSKSAKIEKRIARMLGLKLDELRRDGGEAA